MNMMMTRGGSRVTIEMRIVSSQSGGGCSLAAEVVTATRGKEKLREGGKGTIKGKIK